MGPGETAACRIPEAVWHIAQVEYEMHKLRTMQDPDAVYPDPAGERGRNGRRFGAMDKRPGRLRVLR